MNYQPFPIADFRTGLFTAREAWLAPGDAFPELFNARIYRGQLEKRRGMAELGLFPSRVGNISNVTGGGGSVVTVTVTSHGLSNNDYVIIQSVVGSTEINNKKFFIENVTANTFDLSDSSGITITAYVSGGTVDEIKALTYIADISAISINSSSGELTVTSSVAHGLTDGDRVRLLSTEGSTLGGMTQIDGVVTTVREKTTTTFTLDNVDGRGYTAYTSGGVIAQVNDDPITGIQELYLDDEANKLVVANQKRLAEYSNSLNNMIAISTSDDFTLTNSVKKNTWMVNGRGRLWITNNKDRVKTYDGSSIATPDFYTNGSSNTITLARLIFYYNQRMILLNVTESGTKQPQRVRWSKKFGGETNTDWDDTVPNKGGSLDAATEEEIITATLLRDTLIVFFERSIWALKKTLSADIPFRWEKLADSTGIYSSTFGAESTDDLAWNVGPAGFIATDGVRAQPFDELAPTIVEQIDNDDYPRLVSNKLLADKEVWFSYPYTPAGFPDRVAVYQYDDKRWTQYTMPYNVMGEFTIVTGSTTWRTLSGTTWSMLKGIPWSKYKVPAGFPDAVVGDRYGFLMRVNDGTSDLGRNIDFSIKSARLNPFKEAGASSQLGWVDLLVSADNTTEMTAEFSVDFDDTPVVTETVDFDRMFKDTNSSVTNDQAEKVWKRIYVNTIGNTHQMSFSHKRPDQTLIIHAVVPYFRPVGRYRV